MTYDVATSVLRRLLYFDNTKHETLTDAEREAIQLAVNLMERTTEMYRNTKSLDK